MRTVAVLSALSVLAFSAVACDDDGDEPIENQSVPPRSIVDGDAPFDPDVPDGVDTETDETENQGFDPDDPETGNNSELGNDDGLGG